MFQRSGFKLPSLVVPSRHLSSVPALSFPTIASSMNSFMLQAPLLITNVYSTGTQVLVSRIDPLQETPIHGSVVANDGTSVNVSFTERYEIDEGVWRLDVGISNLIYDRMRVALARLNHDVRLQEPNFVPNDQETILHGTHLRDVLLRSFSPEHAHLPQMLQAPDDVDYPSHQKLDHGSTVGKGQGGYEHMGAFRDDMRIQSWARRYAEIDPVMVEGDPDLSGLNRTQIRALATMIGQRISLIQGASRYLFRCENRQLTSLVVSLRGQGRRELLSRLSSS